VRKEWEVSGISKGMYTLTGKPLSVAGPGASRRSSNSARCRSDWGPMTDTTRSTADAEEARKRYAERERRIADATALKVPDRVPVSYHSQFWHARYAGISNRTAMYDYEALAAATRRVVLELQPDSVTSPYAATALGPTLEMLDYRSMQWPGHGLPDNRPYQYLDGEHMLSEEYDDFIEDPSWFLFTRYLPRVCEAYAPLGKLPRLAGRTSMRVPFYARHFGEPDVAAALQRIAEAGREAKRMLDRAAAFQRELIALGFPPGRGASSVAPYDYLGDFLRGSKGIMLDMRRRPDKLLEAMERLVPLLVRDAVDQAAGSPCKLVHMPLHWGTDNFMSLDQFKTFYWPQLRKVLLGLIAAGLTPLVFWEGQCDSRFETIADVPRATCIYWFERSDLFRAKAVLGDIACLRGNVPASMLIAGSVQEVRDYCRRLIEVVGKGGGFMLDATSGIPEESKHENVFAMFRSVHEFGR